jgi:ArsR family transcriptional regulator
VNATGRFLILSSKKQLAGIFKFGAAMKITNLATKSPVTDEITDIFELIGKSENIEQAAEAMQAMSHPVRLKILCLLGSGELSVQEIVDGVGTSQSNISQHLAILKTRKIILSRKEANKVFCWIEDERILKMIELTRDIFCPA